MSLLLIIEIFSVLCNITYLMLLTRKNIAAWPFGILGAAFGIYLMLHATLYGQAIIHLYYVVIGIYGWWHWRQKVQEKSFKEWPLPIHIKATVLSIAISIIAALLFKTYTDAAVPWTDSFLTIFGFVASYMQARKIMSSWLYWLVIDLWSAWVYMESYYYLYAMLMIFYSVMCVRGYVIWRKA